MRKLSLSLIVVVIASIVGLGWILNQVYLHSTQHQGQPESNPHLRFADDLFAVYSASNYKREFIESWNSRSDLKLELIPLDDFPLPEPLYETFALGERLILESTEGVVAHYVLEGGVDVLAIALPVADYQKDSRQLELTLTLSFYAGVTTIILIWIWPLIHRLMALRDTARLFGRGDLSKRVKILRFSYIREIELEFNRMADRIQSLIEDNKLLSRAVSHDLKTPLARLRFGLDAIAETEDKNQRNKYAERVNRDMEEMESLIDTLLQYARLDESRIHKSEEDVDLASFTQSAINNYDTDNIAITFRCRAVNSSILADKRYLALLINNLLSNAARYAKTQVLVSLTLEKDHLLLSLEDDGEGIPRSEREHVIKPFWRGEKGQNKKGHGMGLAIVSRIAEWHGAELSIHDSEKLGGALVQLKFLAAKI
ncbi:ATP-binding protein [Teredinibacter haidensis]|uniref:ATP-binding protein n=1 Tax=Teredinibacter haidensis TaxID=2731755 RepID=UPI0009489CD9|nr:ATP-binding protein [Teredinibacter haidensis]